MNLEQIQEVKENLNNFNTQQLEEKLDNTTKQLQNKLPTSPKQDSHNWRQR